MHEADPLAMKRAIAAIAAACSIVMLTGWRPSSMPPAWVQASVGVWRGAGGGHISEVMMGAGLTTVDRHIEVITDWRAAYEAAG